jgi:hypothetical protein
VGYRLATCGYDRRTTGRKDVAAAEGISTACTIVRFRPLADIRVWMQIDLMDKSIELFRAEQRRLADDGGLKRHLITTVLSLCLFMLVMWGLMAGLSAFPRNADHSMNVIYYGPVLGLFGLVAALLLRRPFLRKPPFRATLWGLVFVSAVIIPVGAFDALLRNGS